MTKRPNLHILSRDVFEANKAKGFHDENHSDNHFLMLVLTELSEAIESDRKNRHANLEKFYQGIAYGSVFETYIKDTVEDELADAIIRLLDLAGLREYTLPYMLLSVSNLSDNNSFTENVFLICRNIINYKYSDVERINFAILSIEYLSKEILKFDIWKHVELKLEYNRSRENMHGKKY